MPALREIRASVEVDFFTMFQDKVARLAGGADLDVFGFFFGFLRVGFDVFAMGEARAGHEGVAFLVFAPDQGFAADRAIATDFFRRNLSFLSI